MNKYYSQVKRQHIVSIDNGFKLAKFKNIIFNYADLSILAIIIKQINLFSYKEKVIIPRDIIRWTDNIYIQNNNDICDVEDIIRLRNIYYDYVYLNNLSVFTVSGSRLGRIKDYVFCNKTFCLKKLILNQYDISTAEIISIDSEKVIVKDAVIHADESISINTLRPELGY